MRYDFLEIENYCEQMAKALKEKMFFLESEEFQNIDTIIDFGCADGSTIEYIKNKCPHIKRFIGIDINANMLARTLIKCPYAEVATNLDSIKTDKKKTGIIFSSVLHEIFSFCSSKEISNILNQAKKKAKYAFIRDMFCSFSINSYNPNLSHLPPSKEKR